MASQSRIVRSSDNFSLQRHRLPGFPLVLDKYGTLVEPIQDFLRAEAVQRHLAPGTLLDEAYALRAWWDYIGDLSPTEYITADTIVAWVGIELERLRRKEARAPSKRRLSRCLDVIGRFHRHLLDGRRYSEGEQGWRAAAYIGRLDARLADRNVGNVTFSYTAKTKGGGRPTPSDDEVDKVLDALADVATPYLGARNWLLARWMREVGLRRAGVASLTIEHIRAALVGEGILNREEYLTRLGTTLQDRASIRRRIEQFRSSGRTFICGLITEKGPKTREIKIRFEIMFSTLDFIWSERASVAKSNRIIQGPIWLSKKTGRGLTATAVGDIVKGAFNAAGVRGSGHRLRACFAEEVVYRLYALAKEAHGIMFDENQVLIDAAEELGHSDWRSLRSYLNRAARNYASERRAQQTITFDD